MKEEKWVDFGHSLKRLYYNAELDSCTICLEGSCDIVTVCQHYFHYACLKQWLEHQHFDCPACHRNNIDTVLVISCQKCKSVGQSVDLTQEDAEEKVQIIRTRPCGKCGEQTNVGTVGRSIRVIRVNHQLPITPVSYTGFYVNVQRLGIPLYRNQTNPMHLAQPMVIRPQ